MAQNNQAYRRDESSGDGISRIASLSPVFRRAVMGDLPQIKAIFTEGFKGQLSDDDIMLYSFLFPAQIANLKCIFTVAVLGTKVAGFSIVDKALTSDAANLDIIGVDTFFRDAGIGKGLMHEAERATAHMHQPKIQLQVREDNTRAIGFYKKLGYSVIGTEPGYYTNDGMSALVMEKQVAAQTQDNIQRYMPPKFRR